jgi:hypothetical protein
VKATTTWATQSGRYLFLLLVGRHTEWDGSQCNSGSGAGTPDLARAGQSSGGAKESQQAVEGRERCPLVKPCPLRPMVMNGKCSCFPSPQGPAELGWSPLSIARRSDKHLSIARLSLYHLHVLMGCDGCPRRFEATARKRKRPEMTWKCLDVCSALGSSQSATVPSHPPR